MAATACPSSAKGGGRRVAINLRLEAQPLDTIPLDWVDFKIMAHPVTPVRSRSGILWTAAALTLLAGYADLARGGETLAPILLIVGYCVLVPLAILK